MKCAIVSDEMCACDLLLFCFHVKLQSRRKVCAVAIPRAVAIGIKIKKYFSSLRTPVPRRIQLKIRKISKNTILTLRISVGEIFHMYAQFELFFFSLPITYA